MIAIMADIIAFRRAAADGDLALGVVPYALGALKLFDDGVTQWLRAPSDRVLIDVIRMALRAASLISSGAAKSGNP